MNQDNQYQKILKIISQRAYNSWPSCDLLFEWEDVFKECLKCDFYYTQKWHEHPLFIRLPYINRITSPKELSFVFEMTARKQNNIYNSKSVIPCIVDFYHRGADINKFLKSHEKNPIVFISSREAFEIIRGYSQSTKLKHLPLSISDKYRLTNETFFTKDIECALFGRQNPIMENWLKVYAKNHPDFIYVYRQYVNGRFIYLASDGTPIGEANTREEYISLMRRTRISLYATAGVDEPQRTNGYSQVTPRFLELLACGCHVLSRYTQNADTDFFMLNRISPNIKNYDIFEKRMTEARNSSVDKEVYVNYLENHYTSRRVSDLINAINAI